MLSFIVVPPKGKFSMSKLHVCNECGSNNTRISITTKDYRSQNLMYDKAYIEDDEDTMIIRTDFPELFLCVECLSCGASYIKPPVFNCNPRIELKNNEKIVVFLTKEWWNKYGKFINKKNEDENG